MSETRWIPTHWYCRECNAQTSVLNNPVTRFSVEYDAYCETGLCDTCAGLYHVDEEEIFSGDPCESEGA
jgi:hypothetical protein